MFNPSTGDSFAERLDRIEKQNRRLKRTVWVMCAGVSFACMLGADGKEKVGVSDRIEAKEFAVVDADGKQRALLGTDGRKVEFAFFDPDGIRQFETTADPATGQVILRLNHKDEAQLKIWAQPDVAAVELNYGQRPTGGNAIMFATKKSRGFAVTGERKELQLKTEDGTSKIVIFDKDGYPAFSKP